MTYDPYAKDEARPAPQPSHRLGEHERYRLRLEVCEAMRDPELPAFLRLNRESDTDRFEVERLRRESAELHAMLRKAEDRLAAEQRGRLASIKETAALEKELGALRLELDDLRKLNSALDTARAQVANFRERALSAEAEVKRACDDLATLRRNTQGLPPAASSQCLTCDCPPGPTTEANCAARSATEEALAEELFRVWAKDQGSHGGGMAAVLAHLRSLGWGPRTPAKVKIPLRAMEHSLGRISDALRDTQEHLQQAHSAATED